MYMIETARAEQGQRDNIRKVVGNSDVTDTKGLVKRFRSDFRKASQLWWCTFYLSALAALVIVHL